MLSMHIAKQMIQQKHNAVDQLLLGESIVHIGLLCNKYSYTIYTKYYMYIHIHQILYVHPEIIPE